MQPPILVVGFRRSGNLRTLLDQAKSINAPRIYLALDGPRDSKDEFDTALCLEVAKEFQALNPGLLKVKNSSINLGCAFSVIQACDWLFSQEDFAIVIEDDCLPELDFYNYIQDARPYFEKNNQALLICGTQFAPENITKGNWTLSSYPLIWGWATNSTKWNRMISLILEDHSALKTDIPLREVSYWKAGSRRALGGFVDAWDTPLVFGMRCTGSLALLPGQNLVKNIGADEFATHTFEKSLWIERETSAYIRSNTTPELNVELDRWLKEYFYKIRLRHILSTQITSLLDKIGYNKRIWGPLRGRLKVRSDR